MPTSRMNKAYWLKNKAKTLFDKGDTVAVALGWWDEEKTRDWGRLDPKKTIEILHNAAYKAGELKKKASTSLHKQTIELLTYYVTKATYIENELENQSGDGVRNVILEGNPLPVIIATAMKKYESAGVWAAIHPQYDFLVEWKKSGSKGSAVLFNKYVGVRGEAEPAYQLNFGSNDFAAVRAQAALGDFDNSDKAKKAWKKLHTASRHLLETQGGKLTADLIVFMQKYLIQQEKDA